MQSRGKNLLTIEGLRVSYFEPNGERVCVLNGVNLEMRAGEVLGILGESGCGKSTLAHAVLGLIHRSAKVEQGLISFNDVNLLNLSERQLREIRGHKVSLVPQEPALALNPVLTVGTQIAEVLRAHLSLTSKQRRERVTELLSEVGFDIPSAVYNSYPHQLSGGQRQRIVLAQAIACRPTLLIADEPTSKLDAVLRSDITDLFSGLQQKHGMAILLISHDVSLISSISHRIALMYAGSVVEVGKTADILAHPLHPYTQGLLRLARSSVVTAPRGAERFPQIESEGAHASCHIGCRFEPHCPERMLVCKERVPREIVAEPARTVSCFRYEQ